MKNNDDASLKNIIISIIVLVAALLIKSETLTFYTLFITYILMSYKIIITGIKEFLKKDFINQDFWISFITIYLILLNKVFEAYVVVLVYHVLSITILMITEYVKKKSLSLTTLKCDYANIYIKSKLKKVIVENVKVGDRILVKKGERVPLDGIIVSGRSILDVSMIPGERLSVDSNTKDRIVSGSLNIKEDIKIRVTSDYKNSTIKRIKDLISVASTKKSNIEKRYSKVLNIYNYILILFALVYLLTPNSSAYIALSIIILSMFNSLIMSIPITFNIGLGKLIKNSILYKENKVIETLEKTKIAMLSSVGVVTEGKYKISKVTPLKVSENVLLKYVSHAELNSNHKIAKGILKNYNKKIDKKIIKGFKEFESLGVIATVGSKKVLVGSYNFITQNNIKVKRITSPNTVIYVALNDVYSGYIILKDNLKENAKDFNNNLISEGFKKVVLVSGSSIKLLAKKLNITDNHSDLSEDEKLELLYKLKGKKRKKIMYIGDYLFDRKILGTADVSVSFSNIESDEDIEASDIIIVDNDINKVNYLVNLSKDLLKTIRINVLFSVISKIIILLLLVMNLINIPIVLFSELLIVIITCLHSGTILINKN